MRFVDDQQHAVLAGEFAQRLMVTRLRMHDADIRHRWLGQHAGHIARRKRRFQRGNIVELDYFVVTEGSTGGPTLPLRARAVPSACSVMKLSSTVP